MKTSKENLLMNKRSKIAIKFYDIKGSTPVLFVSKELIEYVTGLGKNYIQVGIDKGSGNLLIRPNSDEIGFDVTKKRKSKNPSFGAKVLSEKVLSSFNNLQFKTWYYAIDLDENVLSFPIQNSKREVISHTLDSNVECPVKWLQNDEHHANVKWSINFYKVNSDNTVQFHLSSHLLDYAKKEGMTHVQFGVNNEEQRILVEFNKEKKGISLLNGMGDYNHSITRTDLLFTYLTTHFKSVECRKKMEVKKIKENLFEVILDVNKKITGNVENSSFTWLGERECIKPATRKIRKGKLTVHFYKPFFRRNEEERYTLRVSPYFLNAAKQQEMKYIELTADVDQQRIIVRLNNENKGFRLVNENGEYSSRQEKDATNTYLHLSQVIKNLEWGPFYELTKIDGLTYSFVPHSNKRRRSTTVVGKAKVKKIEKLKVPQKLTVKVAKTSPRTLTMRFNEVPSSQFSTNTTYELELNNTFLTKVQKSGMAYMEFGVSNQTNSFVVRLTNDKRGIPITNKRTGRYFYGSKRTNELFPSLKNRLRDISLDKNYDGKEIENNIYLFSLDNSLTPSLDFHISDVDWLKQEEQIKLMYIKFLESTDNSSAYLSLSTVLIDKIKKSKMKYLEFGVDELSKTLFIRLNNDKKGISLVREDDKHYTPIIRKSRLINSIKSYVDLKENINYSVEQIQEDLFKTKIEGTETSLKSPNDQIDKPISVRWFKENEYEKEENVAITILTRKIHGSFHLHLNVKLIQEIKNAKQKYVEIGLIREENAVVIKLNNDGKGFSMLNERGEYYSSKGFTISSHFHLFTENLEGLMLKKQYKGWKVNDETFVFYVNTDGSQKDTQISEKILSNVKWVPPGKNSKEKFIKYYHPEYSTNQSLTISSGFIDVIQTSKMKYLEFGVEVASGTMYMRLNNERKGILLIKKSSDEIISVLQNIRLITSIKSYLNLIPNINYSIEQIDRYTFKSSIGALAVNTLITTKERYEDKKITWLTQNEHVRKKEIAFTLLKSQRGSTVFMYMTSKLWNDFTNTKKRYMEIGINHQSDAVVFRLNNEGKGFSLVNTEGEYKKSRVIIVTTVYETLCEKIKNLEVSHQYIGDKVSESLYKFYIDTNTNNPQTHLKEGEILDVEWLPLKQ